jgi:hypothetical protein
MVQERLKLIHQAGYNSAGRYRANALATGNKKAGTFVPAFFPAFTA